jgi:hypothetical protein
MRDSYEGAAGNPYDTAAKIDAMQQASRALSPAFGFSFEDLYDPAALARLDGEFARGLAAADAPLHERFAAARSQPDALAYKEEADLLIAVAPHLDRFIARLFGIEEEWQDLVEGHHRLAPLFRVKRKFVQRRAMLKHKAEAAAQFDGPALEAQVATLLGGKFDELTFANKVLEWQANEGGACGRARRRRALRCVGRAHRRRTLATSGRRALQAAATRRSHAPRAGANRHESRATRCIRCTTFAAAKASR